MARPPEGSASETTDEDPAQLTAGSSIRVVANRTGIAADTLRVWERRYGFPRPSRRPGGSRVYSEDEVARLHLVARAVDAGFRPSEVITLAPAELRRLVEASAADGPPRGPLTNGARGADVRGLEDVTSSAGSVAPSLDAVLAALKADDAHALRALLRAAAVSLGPRAFVSELAHPLLVRVGELWAEGALDVRHEHLASTCLTAQLHLLLGALDDGERSPAVLLATLPGEPHLLGIDMVSVHLAANLAAPRVLGADTPPAQIVEAARALAVDAVGLSISPAYDAREASRAVSWLLANLPRDVQLWLGGSGARSITPAPSSVPAPVLVATWADLDAALAALRARIRAR